MIRATVLLASFVLFAGGFALLRFPLLRLVENIAGRRDAAPIPGTWRPLLMRSVPAFGKLSEEEQQRLLAASRELIDTRHWEGCRGLELTPDMRLVIAAQASLLILAIPGEPFPSLREILVYPSTFVPRRACDPRKWLAASVSDPPGPELGETWGNGTVILAWDAALLDASSARGVRNVVLHEFAHELAFEHDLTPRSPLAGWEPAVPDPGTWREVLRDSYEGLLTKLEAKAPTVLCEYAATSLAEFFAVATEAFFEQPRELRDEYSALYERLFSFYRQDPAARAMPA